jgi:hypothetical protein
MSRGRIDYDLLRGVGRKVWMSGWTVVSGCRIEVVVEDAVQRKRSVGRTWSGRAKETATIANDELVMSRRMTRLGAREQTRLRPCCVAGVDSIVA